MFAAVGEALVDLIEHPDGRYEPCLGGSVCNFTRAMALQGQCIRYLNPLSTDTFGARFAQRLTRDGVDLGQGKRSACPTSLAVVSMGEGGVPNYTFHRQHVADRDGTADDLIARLPAALPLIHTGGLALVPGDWPKTRAVLIAAQLRGAVVSVDANLRMVVVGGHASERQAYVEAVQQAMGMAQIVKLSDEDIAALGWQDQTLLEVADRVLSNPMTQLVALTLGAQGAMLATRQAHVQLPIPAEVKVKDTVGAGDCFQAGLLAWLAQSKQLAADALNDLAPADLEAALRHAMAAAAINVQRDGCQPATWAETQAWLGA
jgi:fructokinase